MGLTLVQMRKGRSIWGSSTQPNCTSLNTNQGRFWMRSFYPLMKIRSVLLIWNWRPYLLIWGMNFLVPIVLFWSLLVLSLMVPKLRNCWFHFKRVEVPFTIVLTILRGLALHFSCIKFSLMMGIDPPDNLIIIWIQTYKRLLRKRLLSYFMLKSSIWFQIVIGLVWGK